MTFKAMVMKMKISRYSVLLFALLALCCACSKEPMENPAGAVTKTILYSATVSHGPQTRASISGSEFAAGCYVFEAGDKLYVEYRAGEPAQLKLYGVLDLISGAGTGTGRFEGELKCLNDFTPSNEIVLSATLVGPHAADVFFTFGDPTDDPTVDPGTIVTDVTYPSSVSYTTLPDLVQKYSHFTGTSTYAAKNFNNLTQQSVFLQFNLSSFPKSYLFNPSASTVNVLIKNVSTTLHTVTGVPIGNDAHYGNASFSTVVEAGNAFADAKIQIDDNLEDENVPLVFKQGFSDNLNLVANHYYSVSRIFLDWFRIIAKESGTIYRDGSNALEYSVNGGDWQTYTSPISVNNGDEVAFRSKVQSWNSTGSGANKQYKRIRPDFAFDVAGDITSLLVGDDFGTAPTPTSGYTFVDFFYESLVEDASKLVFPMTSIPSPALKSFFHYCHHLEKGPVELPATSLANQCYRNMFYGCENLISAPIIRRATSHSGSGWYQNMFYGCSSLTKIEFYDNCIWGTNGNNFTDWVNGVNANGDFYKSSDMTNFGNPGNSSIPSGWTVHNE